MKKTILTMALLTAMTTAMAQEHAEVDVHDRYTKVVTPVNGKYESKRPPVEERLFTSAAVEKKIKEVQKLLKKNPKLLDVCQLLSQHFGEYCSLSCARKW